MRNKMDMDKITTSILLLLQFNKLKEIRLYLQNCPNDLAKIKPSTKGRNLLHHLASEKYGDPFKSVITEILSSRHLCFTLNDQDLSGYTPLMIALLDKQLSTAHIFLNQKDLDMNAQNYLARTALMIAAENGFIHVVQKMFDRFPNINPNLQDINGKTALHYAVLYCHTEVVCYLMKQSRLDYDLQDRNNLDVLDLAKNNADSCKGKYNALYQSMLKIYHAQHKHEDSGFTLISADKKTDQDPQYASAAYSQDIRRVQYEQSKKSLAASMVAGVAKMMRSSTKYVRSA